MWNAVYKETIAETQSYTYVFMCLLWKIINFVFSEYCASVSGLTPFLQQKLKLKVSSDCLSALHLEFYPITPTFSTYSFLVSLVDGVVCLVLAACLIGFPWSNFKTCKNENSKLFIYFEALIYLFGPLSEIVQKTSLNLHIIFMKKFFFRPVW